MSSEHDHYHYYVWSVHKKKFLWDGKQQFTRAEAPWGVLELHTPAALDGRGQNKQLLPEKGMANTHEKNDKKAKKPQPKNPHHHPLQKSTRAQTHTYMNSHCSILQHLQMQECRAAEVDGGI